MSGQKVLSWFFAVALVTVVATEVVLACSNPSRLPGKGMRAGATITFAFVGSHPYQSCIEDAIDEWTAANDASGGSGVEFVPVGGGSSPALTFTMVDLGTSVGGGTTSPSRDSQGYITGIGVQINSNTAVLDECAAAAKVARHELGHAQGLADNSGTGGSSVMNPMNGKNDNCGGSTPCTPHMPNDVTSCDASVAAAAGTFVDADDDGVNADDDCDDSNPEAQYQCCTSYGQEIEWCQAGESTW